MINPKYMSAKMAVMDAALALGSAIRAIDGIAGCEWADIEIGHALDIIAESSKSDGRNSLLNCAMEIRSQAHTNIEADQDKPDLLREYSRRDAAALEANRINKCSERATA